MLRDWLVLFYVLFLLLFLSLLLLFLVCFLFSVLHVCFVVVVVVAACCLLLLLLFFLSVIVVGGRSVVCRRSETIKPYILPPIVILPTTKISRAKKINKKISQPPSHLTFCHLTAAVNSSPMSPRGRKTRAKPAGTVESRPSLSSASSKLVSCRVAAA